MTVRLILAAVLLAGTAPAVAAGPLQVTTTMMVAEKVAAADGTTRVRLVHPARVVPGAVVTLVISYRNAGAQPLADLVLASPVPAGLRFRSAQADAELSVDGRRFGPLDGLRIGAGGAARPAQAGDVTHVRWRLSKPLPAGAGGEFAFQAVLQ